MKWPVQPKSTMVWRLTDVLRAGTKVLQENKLFKTKESLGLTGPGVCQGDGLQFLRVASFWWPAAGVGNIRLEWSQRVPHVQQ